MVKMLKLWEQHRKEQRKMVRGFRIALIKLRLSVPEPTSYESWRALHDYLERLENMEGDVE